MEKPNDTVDTNFIKDLFSSAADYVRKVPAPEYTHHRSAEGYQQNHSSAPASSDANRAHEQTSSHEAGQKRQRLVTSWKLSPLASEILRAARSELGKNAEQQQAQFDAVATERDVATAIDRAMTNYKEQLSEVERAELIVHLRTDLLGWGVLQPLIDDPNVTDIHVYDFRTVVCQRGKVSESTALQWPTREAYAAFIDRLLMRIGKSLSTQQHTVDGAFPDGTRVCAIHESVCVGCGPLLSIRVPRISHTTLEMLVGFGLAPQLVIDYLAAITRWGQATMLIAGETGTGKTTLLKGLSTQFDPIESIVTVEDTPELNFKHSFLRSLVSRPPNVEGVGEVTLQEHIKATLRMTPNRVILGEMRTPQAAEAFLESAQTGHTGMSTLHARNARETLVRLESLLGRVQKSVAIDIIRQQIALAVDVIVWMFRDKTTGRPRIGEVIEVGHFVEGSIQVKPIFKYDLTQEQPTWLIESWSSYFDSVLIGAGILLGQQGPTLHLAHGPDSNNSPRLRKARGGG
jgi:pilus assembly protein CpaF